MNSIQCEQHSTKSANVETKASHRGARDVALDLAHRAAGGGPSARALRRSGVVVVAVVVVAVVAGLLHAGRQGLLTFFGSRINYSKPDIGSWLAVSLLLD